MKLLYLARFVSLLSGNDNIKLIFSILFMIITLAFIIKSNFFSENEFSEKKYKEILTLQDKSENLVETNWFFNFLLVTILIVLVFGGVFLGMKSGVINV